MSVQSPRRRTLRRYTWFAGAASLLAGGVIYFQVSGAATALAAVTDLLAPNDPGANGTAGQGAGTGAGGQQVPTPQYSNPGSQQQPIAVTGGS